MGRDTVADMRRIRLRRLKKMNNSSITYTKDEPYAICFYLYNLFEEKTNTNVLNDNDEAIKLFLEHTENLNKTERLKAVLKSEIHNLEKQNKLNHLTTPLKCTPEVGQIKFNFRRCIFYVQILRRT